MIEYLIHTEALSEFASIVVGASMAMMRGQRFARSSRAGRCSGHLAPRQLVTHQPLRAAVKVCRARPNHRHSSILILTTAACRSKRPTLAITRQTHAESCWQLLGERRARSNGLPSARDALSRTPSLVRTAVTLQHPLTPPTTSATLSLAPAHQTVASSI
jgi:hypothetical protein